MKSVFKVLKPNSVTLNKDEILEEREDSKRLTRNPLSDLISMIVKTVSYRIAFPTFLLVSVLVATWKNRQQCVSEKAILPKTTECNETYCDVSNSLRRKQKLFTLLLSAEWKWNLIDFKLDQLTWANISFIASLESSSFRPKILNNRKIRT